MGRTGYGWVEQSGFARTLMGNEPQRIFRGGIGLVSCLFRLVMIFLDNLYWVLQYKLFGAGNDGNGFLEMLEPDWAC